MNVVIECTYLLIGLLLSKKLIYGTYKIAKEYIYEYNDNLKKRQLQLLIFTICVFLLLD
jgi:hypothetical protein